MFKLALTLFLVLSSSLSITAQTQETPESSNKIRLESLSIDLWPEYDRPDLLVIYKGILASAVPLPVELTFRIPVEAGKPTAVAVGPDPATVADVAYKSKVTGDWIEVSFIATTPAIQFEYYDPRLKKEAETRTFSFEWPGDYAVDMLVLGIQHPIGAISFQVTPNSGRVVAHQDGFDYNVIDLGSLESGSTFKIDVNYVKSTDALSIQSLEVQPSAPLTTGVSRRLDVLRLLPWILGAAGVLLIAGGGFLYWRSGRDTGKSQFQRPRKSVETASQTLAERAAVYCHQCGKRAEPGDRFCRACGTRLRRE